MVNNFHNDELNDNYKQVVKFLRNHSDPKKKLLNDLILEYAGGYLTYRTAETVRLEVSTQHIFKHGKHPSAVASPVIETTTLSDYIEEVDADDNDDAE